MAVILHVVNTYFAVPYFIGGQFLYFKEKGHDMHLICPESDYLEPFGKKMGYKYYNLEITRTYTPVKDMKALIAISRYARKNKVDIIVGHTPKGALLAMIAGKLNNIPKRIYFRHGLIYETKRGLSRKILVLAEKVAAYCATRIICVSPSLLEVSSRDKLNPEYKQSIIGRGTCGGIDTIYKFNPDLIEKSELSIMREQYKIYTDDTVIGFCGRLVPDKGICELVEALDILRSKNTGKRFILLLVGVFESRDKLPSTILEKIKSDKDIVLTGFINRNIQYFYALMNFYILPSYREGFGMSVIEASAMKIPVLTTKATGCIDSIVENVTGKYVENTPLSIAEGIEFLLKNPDKARSFGRAGRDFVKNNFDNLILWKELEKFYC
jgi:glycosyltransferase involved in cell wall biosynthesis